MYIYHKKGCKTTHFPNWYRDHKSYFYLKKKQEQTNKKIINKVLERQIIGKLEWSRIKNLKYGRNDLNQT